MNISSSILFIQDSGISPERSFSGNGSICSLPPSCGLPDWHSSGPWFRSCIRSFIVWCDSLSHWQKKWRMYPFDYYYWIERVFWKVIFFACVWLRWALCFPFAPRARRHGTRLEISWRNRAGIISEVERLQRKWRGACFLPLAPASGLPWLYKSWVGGIWCATVSESSLNFTSFIWVVIQWHTHSVYLERDISKADQT